jgi:hypothetical protein
VIHDVPKPEISPDFTIDDIHRIREWNYERRKDASVEERLSDISRGAEEARRAIEEIRRKNALKAG